MGTTDKWGVVASADSSKRERSITMPIHRSCLRTKTAFVVKHLLSWRAVFERFFCNLYSMPNVNCEFAVCRSVMFVNKSEETNVNVVLVWSAELSSVNT